MLVGSSNININHSSIKFTFAQTARFDLLMDVNDKSICNEQLNSFTFFVCLSFYQINYSDDTHIIPSIKENNKQFVLTGR